MNDKLRLLLVDDHNVVRAGLRALIDARSDLEVVGEADNGELACQMVIELDPDIVIMDVSLPLLGGVAATSRIKRDKPAVKVLALTVHEDRGYLQQLLQVGASGYLLKRAAADELIQAIRTVARGGTYLDTSLAGKLVGQLARRPEQGIQLSDREQEVLRFISRGFTNREIAARLDLSVKTVETHKARSMEKLGLDSRAAIVAYAIGQGWMTDD